MRSVTTVIIVMVDGRQKENDGDYTMTCDNTSITRQEYEAWRETRPEKKRERKKRRRKWYDRPGQ